MTKYASASALHYNKIAEIVSAALTGQSAQNTKRCKINFSFTVLGIYNIYQLPTLHIY